MDSPSDQFTTYFYYDPQGAWYPTKGHLLYELDNVCVRIHDAFAASLFGTFGAFYDFLKVCPEFIYTAGMNSEAPIGKALFEQFISKMPEEIPVNKALYLFDCRKLVSSIQECSKEVIQLQDEFYRALNMDKLFFPEIEEDDGIRYVTSPAVTKIFAFLGFIFVRLHSLLDYVAKLAIESENLRSDFEVYSRLASKKSLFSDRKRISFNEAKGTLLEACVMSTEIESVRNHLIHDGLLDDTPKVYRVISSGICIEKFILFPDMNASGRFESYKNRNLFYGNEDKINIRLPRLILEFQERLLLTLHLINDNLSKTNAS
ncbi:hypothetical protein [Salinicola halophyticus]|uniref:hypothetical protein n=1 Tax=Salinicola halophyticus TaxID=1808881 RepID=UPI001CB6EA8A|nr:hypothetical protein [Salinicola halophyticus]